MNLAKTVFLLILTLCLPCGVAPAQNVPEEEPAAPIDIEADAQRRAEEIRQGKPVPKIEDPDLKMPEVPKPITRGRLGEAEEVQLARLESENIDEKMTDLEKNVEKDLLARDSNVKF